MRRFYYLLSIMLCVCSCAESLDEKIIRFNNHGIILPDTDMQDESTRSALSEHSPKIITFIDGRCNLCLDDLRVWHSLAKDSTFKSYGTEIIYCIASPDRESLYTWTRLYPAKNIIIDPKRDFIKANNIELTEKVLHAFLLDKDNKVILVGSPINNSKMWELYKSTIRKLVANNGEAVPAN